MDIHTRYYNDVIILSVNGRFDAVSTSYFAQVVNEQIAAGYQRLVVDLKKVDFLDSSGIKALVQATQLARQQGGDFRVANARGHVKFVLNLASIDSIIKVYPNVVSATASYFPGPVQGQ
jgi:anti-sigma B factor antagonist